MAWAEQLAGGTRRSESNTVVIEAEDVIKQWLQGVENCRETYSEESLGTSVYAWGSQSDVHQQHQHDSVSKHRGMQPMLRPLGAHGLQLTTPTETSHREPTDFLTSLDWSEGDVRMNAKAIVEDLMTKSLAGIGQESPVAKKKPHNPHLTMEMRHKAVKERRQAKDRQRLEVQQTKMAEHEARREAERLVKMEEELQRRRQAREEQIVREQMAIIRKQLREERNRKRLLDSTVKSMAAPPVPPPALDIGDHNAVLKFANECVRESELERKRFETRAELMKQLQEADTTEEKEKLRLLRQVFTSWHGVVAQERAKLRKATAVREWRLLVKVWKGWRCVVMQAKSVREQKALARELQRQKRYIDMAVSHYHHRLMLRCVSSWIHWTKVHREQRREELRLEQKREKMAAFLQAALEGRVRGNQELPQSPSPPTLGHSESIPVDEHTRVTTNTEGTHVVKAHTTTGSKGKGPPQPILWQDQLLAESGDQQAAGVKSVEKTNDMATREHVARSEEGKEVSQAAMPSKEVSQTAMLSSARPQHQKGSKVTRKSEIGKLAWRPPPKPAALIRMEDRSAEIAKRRAAREARRAQQEAEKLAEMEQKEEETRTLAREAKKQLAEKKREERRLAQQREAEKQQRMLQLAELMDKANKHYHRVLLRSKGLKPWQQFIQVTKEQHLRAEKSNCLRLLRSAFLPWRQAAIERERRREKTATDHYNSLLLQRSMRCWIRYIALCKSLDDTATRYHQWLIVHRAFRGWERTTRAERVREWEVEKRADLFCQRLTKRHVLRAWVKLVPQAKQERLREERREELRRKVAVWLPDFHPCRDEL